LRTVRPGQFSLCHHRGANLSHREVRPRSREGLRACRRGRYAGDVRSRPDNSAARDGSAHAVSSASAMSNAAASFEPYRRLLGLAYRVLGSMAEAEGAVEETYLRWHAADRDKVSEARAFLMTTTTRICLDILTSARARREEYVGPWLPEPVVDEAALAPDSRSGLGRGSVDSSAVELKRPSPSNGLPSCCTTSSISRSASGGEPGTAARARAHLSAVRPRGTQPPPALDAAE
jgi:RNA polymerase sigma-70 factor (ECF subfamily)